ncbi:MAG TPA: hypothetical protein VGR56_03340 [Nitrososphaerales archaeon]|nr:hypothetical protein [Nitrososphaerales archaeon]
MSRVGASPKKGGNIARGFTIELKSRGQVKSVSVPNGAKGVLIEGTLGTLKHADFLDGVVLEVTGEGGTLRVDLAREDLVKHAVNAKGGGESW